MTMSGTTSGTITGLRRRIAGSIGGFLAGHRAIRLGNNVQGVAEPRKRPRAVADLLGLDDGETNGKCGARQR